MSLITALVTAAITLATGAVPPRPPPPAQTAVAPPTESPVRVLPAESIIGERVPDLEVTADGAGHPLHELCGTRATVVAMTSATCPVSKRFAPDLARLESEFTAPEVTFLYVTVPGEDVEAARAALRQAGANAPVVGAAEELVRALRAATSTEVFVLDAERVVRYRGAVSDQYGLTYNRVRPRAHYLRGALNAIVSGRPPPFPVTSAPGCAVNSTARSATANPAFTFGADIAPLVAAHCLECHHQGGSGPFALETYHDVTSKAAMIRQVIEDGRMPPWFAAAAHAAPAMSPWSNDRTMPAADRAALLRWIDDGMPAGDLAKAPPIPAYPKEWEIGEPDLVLEIPTASQVPAEGVLPYVMVNVPTELTEERFVQAVEVEPSNKGVVHHVLVFAVPPPSERGTRKKASDGIDGARGFFAAYVPGNPAAVYPDGFARRLPAGGSLTFALHYVPNGVAGEDQTRIAFRFAKERPAHLIESAGISDRGLLIPPGVTDFPITSTARLDVDVRIVAYLPHMHLRGIAFRYEALTPDGARRTLLDVPHYDFNWQLRYLLREPLALPRGTTLAVTGWFDNSLANPANPDATTAVRWGPQTYEEMNTGYVEYYVDTPNNSSHP